MKNDNNEDSFESFMDDVKPLRETNQVHFNGPNKSTLAQTLKRQSLNQNRTERFNYLTTENVTPIDPNDLLEYKQQGIQEGVYKKLRLGKYGIDKSVSLQQMPFEKARQLLFESTLQSYDAGSRTLLVKHGLGLHSKPFPGFLKSYVNQWLRQIPEVIAFFSAQKRHGGMAAVYVLLKKNRQDKLANSEMHRKRG